MTSAADRAASLAAQLTTALASMVSIDYDAENGAAIVRIQVPDSTDPLTWGRIQCALIDLPPQDDFGSLRATDGSIHLWATMRDNPDRNHP